MRDNLEAYKIWAPEDSLWARWAKPVLFSSRRLSNEKLNTPETEWAAELKHSALIIVDLPGKDGVEEGLALAKLGYRPVPLYNGVDSPGDAALVSDVGSIANALFAGAEILTALNIRPDASPAFLLDSNRLGPRAKIPGKYDNRWCVFPQDMPSAAFLAENGISRVVVRTQKISDDLSHILCRYQERGIRISTCRDGIIKETVVVAPSKFRQLRYRFEVILGLTRNAAGGFGGKVPEVNAAAAGTGRGGGVYYRYG